tara:strand:- start:484 stop:678 length:195 start_codon:yes stop_codon:yes gene_type:complete
MSLKKYYKILRMQRHLTETKRTETSLAETQIEGSERIIKDKQGLKKSIVHKGSRYTVDLNKELK